MKNIKLNLKNILVFIAIFVFVFVSITLFLKYEQELVFIKYLPETMKTSIDLVHDDYKITVPLHRFAFVEDYDMFLKPSVKYFTFVDADEIKEFYSETRKSSEKNHKVYNYDGVFFYFDEADNTYVQIPIECIIIEKNIFFRKVGFKLLDIETIREIVEKNNL